MSIKTLNDFLTLILYRPITINNPPSLIEYFEIQRILGNINRVPRNSGALGEIAREAREKNELFGGFTGGKSLQNGPKTIWKYRNINRVLRNWGAPKNPTINRVPRIPD